MALLQEFDSPLSGMAPCKSPQLLVLAIGVDGEMWRFRMDTVIPFSSLLFEGMVSTPEMRAIWSEQNTVQKWMDVEAAITRAQMDLDMIPHDAGEQIIGHLTLERFPIEKISAKKQLHDHLMVSFLKAFREVCGPAAEYFHVGPTTQDILDTGVTLQIREANAHILAQMLSLEEVFCDQAMRYRDSVMMGRTHQQHALPLTFGFVLAGWANQVRDHIERVRESGKRHLFASVSGGVGTQNAYVELVGEEKTRALEDKVCRALELRSPLISLHSRTDRFGEVVSNLAALCSSMGNIGMNIVSLQRTEVMEVEESSTDDRYGSSTMPNKLNPEVSEQVDGLSKIVRSLASAMQDIGMHEQRDATRMPVQFTALPLSYMMTARALTSITDTIENLVVHEDRMRKNLEHPNFLGQAVGERLMIRAHQKTGKRDWAHTILHDCARICREEGRWFRDVVSENADMGRLFTKDELDEIFDLTTYTGTAGLQTDQTVRALRSTRPQLEIRD
jgi:adenylosuccinate lyase